MFQGFLTQTGSARDVLIEIPNTKRQVLSKPVDKACTEIQPFSKCGRRIGGSEKCNFKLSNSFRRFHKGVSLYYYRCSYSSCSSTSSVPYLACDHIAQANCKYRYTGRCGSFVRAHVCESPEDEAKMLLVVELRWPVVIPEQMLSV
eukprot:767271-Hanusia_phi.AAC.8